MPDIVIGSYATRGSVGHDFDFSQAPRPPVVLPVHPPTTLSGAPGG